MNIDSRFVDCDFRAFPQYVPGDLGRDDSLCASMRSYEDYEKPLTEAELRDAATYIDAQNAGIEWLVTRVFNQGNEGSCVGNMVTQMHQVQQAARFGKDKVKQLSAVSIYKQIGRSAQSGAMVSDAMDAVCETGIVPLDTPENRAEFGDCVMPHRGFSTPYPRDWKQTAKRFTMREPLVIRTREGLLSAGVRGRPVGVGRDGHSILYLRPIFANRKWVYLYVNSWLNWGQALAGFDHGFGTDSERTFLKSAGWAFTCGDVTDYRIAA